MESAPLPEPTELLERITRIGLGHAGALDPQRASERILEEVLGASRSEFGFVAVAPDLHLLASSELSWSRELGDLCEGGLEAALARVVRTGTALVSTTQKGEQAPLLGCLAVLPLKHGEQLVGAIGLARRAGTYTADLLKGIEPLCAAAAALLRASSDRFALLTRKEGERLSVERLRRLERLEALSHLASGIAHDMNNILVAILGNVDLVSGGLEAEELDHALLRKDLEQVVSAGQRATDLTLRMQAFGRRRATEVRAVQPRELLEALKPPLQSLAGDGVELHFEAEDSPLEVMVDPLALELILWCLALNAREALQGGGVIRIGAEGRSADRVALTVSDSGRGMEGQELIRARELFFSTKELGAGLGLPTAERLTVRAGGSLELASLPGEGTTVTVLLPATRP